MVLKCIVCEQVSASPEALFAAASDFANAPSRISGIKKMEMLTQGPAGVGTKFRETRVMFGREATETMEVVAFEPGRSYTLRAMSCGCEYTTKVSVEPTGGNASEISFDFASVPQTFGAKVMGAAMGWMMKGACVKMVRRDLLDLKGAVEKDAAR
jgi:hypothetical protein